MNHGFYFSNAFLSLHDGSARLVFFILNYNINGFISSGYNYSPNFNLYMYVCLYIYIYIYLSNNKRGFGLELKEVIKSLIRNRNSRKEMMDLMS